MSFAALLAALLAVLLAASLLPMIVAPFAALFGNNCGFDHSVNLGLPWSEILVSELRSSTGKDLHDDGVKLRKEKLLINRNCSSTEGNGANLVPVLFI